MPRGLTGRVPVGFQRAMSFGILYSNLIRPSQSLAQSEGRVWRLWGCTCRACRGRSRELTAADCESGTSLDCATTGARPTARHAAVKSFHWPLRVTQSDGVGEAPRIPRYVSARAPCWVGMWDNTHNPVMGAAHGRVSKR